MKFILESIVHDYLIGDICNHMQWFAADHLKSYLIDAVKRKEVVLIILNDEYRIIHILDRQNIDEFMNKYAILL